MRPRQLFQGVGVGSRRHPKEIFKTPVIPGLFYSSDFSFTLRGLLVGFVIFSSFTLFCPVLV